MKVFEPQFPALSLSFSPRLIERTTMCDKPNSGEIEAISSTTGGPAWESHRLALFSQPTFVLPNHPCDQTYSMNHTKWARGHVLDAYFVCSSVLNGSTDVLETVGDVRGCSRASGPFSGWITSTKTGQCKRLLTDCFTKWDVVIVWPPVPLVGKICPPFDDSWRSS